MNDLLFILRKVIFAAAFVTILTYAGQTLSQWANFKLPVAVSAENNVDSAPTAIISDPATVADERNNIEVYQALAPGVVLISTNSGGRGNVYGQESEERGGTGSGSVIDNSGHILTNFHVVENARRLSVNLGGDKAYPARIVGVDPDTDLAIIKIDAPAEVLTIVPLGDSENLQVGQKVLAIGNPFGLDRTLTTGVISGLQRPIRARNQRPIEGAIQTDASINPGNSGGPLLDSRGRMIGVNSQILSPSGASNGIGFAIPASIVKRIAPQLIQFGEVRRPRLGVGTRSIAELIEHGVRLPVENGLLVMSVAPGSAAEKAGLRPTRQAANGEIVAGDIITAIDGEKLLTIDDLYSLIDKHQIDDVIEIEIYRDGGTTKMTVKLQTSASSSGEKSPNEKSPKTPR